jgi:TM2 domain-containing membrane protein YozV
MVRLCLAALFFFMAYTGVQAQNAEYRQYGKVSISPKDTAQAVPPLVDATHGHKHKLAAALLAFPLGVFGLHRMYLGSSAAIPIFYIATFGGGFGILPFIDCVLILINKDVNTYDNNPRIFMWSKPKTSK